MKINAILKLLLICIFNCNLKYIVDYFLSDAVRKSIIAETICTISFTDIICYFMVKNMFFRKYRSKLEIVTEKQVYKLYCNKLKKALVEFPLDKIDKTSSEYCFNMTNLIVKNTNIIPERFFANNLYLKHIHCNKHLKIISNGAFQNCISLKTVILPKELDEIHKNAFQNCISLKVIYIPKNIKLIQESAFDNCISLEQVFFY